MRALSTLLIALCLSPLALADDPATTDDPATKQATAQEEAAEQEKPFSFWMEKKLEYSQEMLKGLAIGDMKLVATKAEQMRILSKVEGWVRSNKPGYKAQLQAFDFANAEIKRHATGNNLEGTAMAFQQLTTSCVSCHAMLRKID